MADSTEDKGEADPTGSPIVHARRDGGNHPGRGALSSPGSVTKMLSPVRYLAWLYSPPSQQRVLAALCAIESEVASSLRPGIDHHVAHARLQWWREECERSVQGRPVHPLTRELVKAYEASAADKSPLVGIVGFVDTAVWDLAGATFETRKELTAYCERWATAMFEPAAAYVMRSAQQPNDAERAAETTSAQIGLARSASAQTVPSQDKVALRVVTQNASMQPSNVTASGITAPVWRSLGAAVREVELLADLARESHTGRLRIPLDELERAAVEPSSMAKTPWPDALAALLRERYVALRATIAGAVSKVAVREQPNYRGLLVWAALASRLSGRAQHALPDTIAPRRYHAFADGWQAWRAARRAAAGNLRLS